MSTKENSSSEEQRRSREEGGLAAEGLESIMVDLGRSRFRKKLQSAIEGGRRTAVGGAKQLLQGAASVVARELREKSSKGGRGRRHVALPYIRKVGVEKAAYIGVKTMLDVLTLGEDRKLTRLAALIGSRVEDEVRFREFKKRHKNSFKYADKITRTSNDYRYRANVIRHIHRLADEECEWHDWGTKTQFHIGMLIINVALESTGLFETKAVVTYHGKRRGKRNQQVVNLTQEAFEEIMRRDAALEILAPWYLPTAEEPLPWTKPWGGGYDPEKVPGVSLVATRNKWYFEMLKQTPMPKVYRAVNALQRTAWSVNEDVLVVLEALIDQGAAVAGLPTTDAIALPPRPEFLPEPVLGEDGKAKLTKEQREALTAEEQSDFKDWKLATRSAHLERGRVRCKSLMLSKIIVVARMFKDMPRFYFPHKLDWRGRAYPIPQFLSPQGHDVARGILQFAEGKPLGEMGGFWLAVHGANCWGEDKVSLEERVAWVEEHEQEIRQTWEDPLTNLWWADAAEPWQFLAFCFEWAEYEQTGYNPEFVSRLAVAMDGTCNGLQHFSAMLRDRVGAEATNLLATKQPQDIYQRVADRVVERLKKGVYKAAYGGGEFTQEEMVYARQWLDSGLIDRTLVKRQVMTLPYGVTRYGMRDQLEAHLQKTGVDQKAFFEDPLAAQIFFTGILASAIDDVVSAAQRAMAFLQGCAEAAKEENTTIMWLAPTGFPVLQHYPKIRSARIETLLLGKMFKPRFLKLAYSEIDHGKQKSGISPNFVHSLDAAHMMLTVVGAEGKALQELAWAMVHDSYGTHAGTAQILAEALREQFVAMYEKHDVLAEFHATLSEVISGLPALPEKGDLDIAQVHDAQFFFA